MKQIVLNKVVPAEAINRWYSVAVQATLLDPVTVVCCYGSRETSWQQVRALPTGSPDEARALLEKITRCKLRRGYKIISDV